MSEREKIERRRKGCVKRGLGMVIPALLALVLVWAWVQPFAFPRGWRAPSLAYELAPQLFVRGNMSIGSLVYTATLIFVVLWPWLEFKGWWALSEQLWRAESAAKKRRLEDEF